jgi:hypothetical protein
MGYAVAFVLGGMFGATFGVLLMIAVKSGTREDSLRQYLHEHEKEPRP